jgi:hypothetical protein
MDAQIHPIGTRAVTAAGYEGTQRMRALTMRPEPVVRGAPIVRGDGGGADGRRRGGRHLAHVHDMLDTDQRVAIIGKDGDTVARPAASGGVLHVASALWCVHPFRA